MSNAVRALEPSTLWNHFADLNAVPRPSKKEERVIAFMKNFGEDLALRTEVDHVGNVIIRKPATRGLENKPTLILQSHLDMVHQKNNDTKFDFDQEGIRMLIEEGWVTADGTTLGADNGIGVAAIMAILSSKDIPHPAIEALFTIDEETGMTGAQGLKSGVLEGRILLNLDTEEDDEIDIGCAGGIDTTVELDLNEETPQPGQWMKLTIKGLKGGHSGMDIHLGRGNANKLLVRLLFETYDRFGLQLAEIDGGGLRNAIPREAWAKFLVKDLNEYKQWVKEESEAIKTEYRTPEPALEILLEDADPAAKVLAAEEQKRMLAALYAMPNGVYRMSPDIPDLVETSSNLARVLYKDGHLHMASLQRSAVESSKMDLAAAIRANWAGIGADAVHSGSYPGWAPNPDSAILKVLEAQYKDVFKEDPQIVACHAGLECGILAQNYPGMDMISFGPTIRGAHSPDEKVNIESVQKFWKFLLSILADSPE
jgi:dipeptidase D